MAENYITGDIGGQTQNIFVGTPGLPGGAVSGGNGFLDSIGSSTAGSFIGGGVQNIGNALVGAFMPANSAAANASASLGTTSIADYFFRGVIIILGFIFMAVGLSMFRQAVVIQQTGNAFKKVGKHIVGKK